MTEIKEKLLPLLRQIALEMETGIEEGEDPTDLTDEIINEEGWIPVRDVVIQILEDQRYQELWRPGINVIYGGICDRKPLEDMNYFIALIYACMTRYPTNHLDHYEATVWSLILKLKKIGTNTDYDPLEDPKVRPFYDAIMNGSQNPTSS